MPGNLALLTPLGREASVELSTTLFRKQILPKGSISYKGRKITFDDAYLADLAQAYREGAVDQVAFLLAKDDNTHTMDPERFRGEVKGLEVTSTGLDMLFDLTTDAAELVRKNPRLGVSARIIEGLERADGKKFPRVIQHVLGTLDPRVTGMKPWQEVALSEEVSDTLDITTEEVTTLSDTSGTSPPGTGGGPSSGGTRTQERPSEDRRPDPSDGGVFDQDDLDDDESYDDITDEELERAGASLSRGPGGVTVDMLHAADTENMERVQNLELELARQRFVNESRDFLEAGVPPVLVELARPILSLPRAPVIELSTGEKTDIGQLVREMLAETKGFIQLAQENGSSWNPRADGEDRADQILEEWKGGK